VLLPPDRTRSGSCTVFIKEETVFDIVDTRVIFLCCLLVILLFWVLERPLVVAPVSLVPMLEIL
jgi:hypothetical protein